MENHKPFDKDLAKNKHKKSYSKPKESSSINRIISIFRKGKLVKKSKVQNGTDTELQTMKKAEFKENMQKQMLTSENNKEHDQKENEVSDEFCENFSGKIISKPLQHRGRGKKPLQNTVNMQPTFKPASPSSKKESYRSIGRGRGLDIYRKTHIRPGTIPPLSDTEQEDVKSTLSQPDHKYFFIMKQPSFPVKQFSQGPTTYPSRLADCNCSVGPKFIQYVIDSHTPTTYTCSPTMRSLLRF